jgi:hypothetical protein
LCLIGNTMALSKYTFRNPPITNLRLYLAGELRAVESSSNSIVDLLKALDVPIEIGPADSGGVGFRVLRIPN